MSASQEDFVVQHYASRAAEYVASTTHSTGEDLQQIALVLRGCNTARVLDLGCGGGHVSYAAAPHVASVLACDVTASMLDAVAQTAAERGLSNITTLQASAEQLPLADAAFDFVLCRFSAHHWHNLEAGLREARRVLAPGGRAVFIDVIAPASPLLDTHLQTLELLRDASHVRDYSLAEWVAALARARFSLTGITTRKLRMEFAQWVQRTHTPAPLAEAIRIAQANAPSFVRSYYDIAPDGSFDLDTATLLNQPL